MMMNIMINWYFKENSIENFSYLLLYLLTLELPFGIEKVAISVKS